MPLLVVAGNNLGARGVSNYRGTFRERPPYGDGLPDGAEYNRLFHWYCEEGGESGVVDDLDRARALLRLLRADVRRKDFELIEATRATEKPRVGGELLGYDLSCAWSYSLLCWGLDLRQAQQAPELSSAIRDLSALIEAHFKPLLNERGLFSEEGTADFCLRSMMALQALSPGLWENEEASDFEVVAIFKVAEVEVTARDSDVV